MLAHLKSSENVLAQIYVGVHIFAWPKFAKYVWPNRENGKTTGAAVTDFLAIHSWPVGAFAAGTSFCLPCPELAPQPFGGFFFIFYFSDLWRWKTRRMAPVHREEVVWQERVAGEVEKIRSKNQERKQEDILRAWRGNRYLLLLSPTLKHADTPCSGPKSME